MDLILYKSSDLKPLSPLEVLGEFAKNRFGKYFPVAVKLQATITSHHANKFVTCHPYTQLLNRKTGVYILFLIFF